MKSWSSTGGLAISFLNSTNSSATNRPSVLPGHWTEANQSNRTRAQDWSPHMTFIFKGSRISALQLKGWFKSTTSIQKYRNETPNSYWTCAWIIWYMFPVQCEELRINHLTLLLVVTMTYACWFLRRADYTEDFQSRLHFQFGVAFRRVVLREV